jgi:hypothetical protein
MVYKSDRGPKANEYCPVCYHALPPDLAEAYRHRLYKRLSYREFESIIYALMEADPHGRGGLCGNYKARDSERKELRK